MKKILFALGALALLSSPMHAATLKITEGTRDTVDGSDAHYTDADNTPNGYVLGSVGFGGGANEYTDIDVHGRIVGQSDYYNFTATSSFTIEFIFDDVFVNGSEIASGFVKEGGGDNASDFTLDLNGFSVSGSPLSFTTNVTSGPSLLFSGVAGGTYLFGVDSTITDPSRAATYDIRISAVPLPAAGLLLLAGLGGLGALRRKKKS